MDKRRYFEADCLNLNRQARLTEPGGDLTPAEKLLDRILPWKNKAPGVQPEDLADCERIAGLIASLKERVDWEQELAPAAYAVFDTETTGLHPFRGDEIMSLGAVLVEKGRLLPEPFFDQLVNPRRPVSIRSQKITGITGAMLQDQPAVYAALAGFLQFTGPRILVAHHATFDLAFLNLKIGEAAGARIVNPVIDTALLAAVLYPSLINYSLEGLAPRFKLELAGRHTALGDARITAALFLKILPRLIESGITTLPGLARLLCDNGRPGFPLIF
jgi:DNA polymerase III epsilon subunit family exonuclease